MIRILIPLLLLSSTALAAPKDPYTSAPRAKVHEALRQKMLSLNTKTIALVIICDEKDCAIANINGDEK